MGLILCIETGTDICSVALARDGEMIALRESDLGKDHARKVGVFTQELLRENNIEPDELDAVAVGKGPGSYTGLRIGVSFAKGLCYALGIPLIAVDSLRSLSACLAEEVEAGILTIEDWDQAALCPMIDARRMEVYAELFDTKLNPLSEVVAEVVTDRSFYDILLTHKKLIIFGNGAEKCSGILEWAEYVSVAPSARGLCAEAERRLQAGQTEDVAYFEPFYLKDFIVTASKKKLF
ncbi:MAG: tRNA (adenosine(37)-N6)-threonylcarbamoyltransferase complex dimerization subunit type 1 TsaB [Tidjanibacter sp.]|jgi:tRNA threonylcarbamoyladenosine biosynthesis protein TsaB|nr:tRNA (adenosine(37)-N6)-threonylcarbamoyltransferase complex dimerization subunit type 1 TsaB [Tidjanibacter sp.]